MLKIGHKAKQAHLPYGENLCMQGRWHYLEEKGMRVTRMTRPPRYGKHRKRSGWSLRASRSWQSLNLFSQKWANFSCLCVWKSLLKTFMQHFNVMFLRSSYACFMVLFGLNIFLILVASHVTLSSITSSKRVVYNVNIMALLEIHYVISRFHYFYIIILPPEVCNKPLTSSCCVVHWCSICLL